MCFVLPRSDHQDARPLRDRLHGFDTIHYQVDDHLLQLNPITEDLGESRRQLHSQGYPLTDELTLYEFDYLRDETIDVDQRLLNVRFFHQRPDTPPHLACANTVVYY